MWGDTNLIYHIQQNHFLSLYLMYRISFSHGPVCLNQSHFANCSISKRKDIHTYIYIYTHTHFDSTIKLMLLLMISSKLATHIAWSMGAIAMHFSKKDRCDFYK